MAELTTKIPGTEEKAGTEKGPHAEKGRLAASSILEVVIALVLIVLVLGLSMTIYANVMRSALPARSLRAELTLWQAMDRLEQTGADQSATNAEGWQISQQVKAYEGAVETPAGTLSVAELTLSDEYHNELARLIKVILLKPSAHE